MKRAIASLILLAACASAPPPPTPATLSPAPSPIAFNGYLPLHWDEATGKLSMDVRLSEEVIWQVSLPARGGSNPIGLDRGELGGTHIVRFERIGNKILMIEPNYRFRAISNDPNEQRAVADSFAQSVIASFKVESGNRVDATDFFLSDAHGVVRRLKESDQGSYSLDKNRSAIYMPRTKSFERNTEVEAILTFAAN